MLRQFCRLAKVQRTNKLASFSRFASNQSDEDKYFDDSLLPKFSKEGIPMRDPRDINDPDYDKPVGNIESENFTFDYESGIGQTKEDETQHFEEYVSKFGEARFADMAPKVQSREFSVSADPNDWKYVERLLPKTLIPNITPKENFASGSNCQRYLPMRLLKNTDILWVDPSVKCYLCIYKSTLVRNGTSLEIKNCAKRCTRE